MTSLAVRNEVKTMWPSLLPTIKLVETENVDAQFVRQLPSIWARIGFSNSTDFRASLGDGPNLGHWRETGIITMRVYVKSGTGSDNALSLAETIRSAWLDYVGLSGNLEFMAISPPLDLADGESDGDWYAVQVQVSYRYDTYK